MVIESTSLEGKENNPLNEAAAADADATDASAADADAGIPRTVWIIGAVILLAIVALVLYLNQGDPSDLPDPSAPQVTLDTSVPQVISDLSQSPPESRPGFEYNYLGEDNKLRRCLKKRCHPCTADRDCGTSASCVPKYDERLSENGAMLCDGCGEYDKFCLCQGAQIINDEIEINEFSFKIAKRYHKM